VRTHRRQFFALLAVLALAGGDACPAAAAPRLRQGGRPNVLVILTDDQGYHDAGFQGCPDIPTPNMDRLARRGVICSNGYVAGCVCSPSRAGIMTGRYPQRFGYDSNPPWSPDDAAIGLDLRQVTLADTMRGAGYVTGHVGKWHLGASAPYLPQRRGFDEHFGFLGAYHDYYRTTDSYDSEGLSPILDNGRVVSQDEITYLTNDFHDQAIDFIERHAVERWFLYLAYNSVHIPMEAPQEYLDRFPDLTGERQIYAAKLSAVDDSIGGILDLLDQLGLTEETLIFFLTDNGGPLNISGPNGADNTPLQGEKSTMWEGGIRVPFVVSWPGHLPSGITYEQPVIALDIFPTAAAAAGAGLPLDLDGVNLLPFLAGEDADPPHAQLFWREQMYSGVKWAVRQGRYKLVVPVPENRRVLLYDLDADISETTDLAAQMPDLVQELQQAYDAWNAQNEAPRWKN
jgi:arylsulfatase A-like enzyme